MLACFLQLPDLPLLANNRRSTLLLMDTLPVPTELASSLAGSVQSADMPAETNQTAGREPDPVQPPTGADNVTELANREPISREPSSAAGRAAELLGRGVGDTGPSASVASSTSWQVAMKTAIRSGVELCRRLQLSTSWEDSAVRAERLFPVFAPLSYVERMRPGDPHDPLLRQVLPLADELTDAVGFSADPVGDQSAGIAPRLLQKYSGRVLLLTTGTCAVHCRYCFRREYPYASPIHPSPDWDVAIGAIAGDASIHEVLLSGGDPLTLTDPVLSRLVGELASIPHLQRIRVHTRLPIVIPQRVTESLLDWLLGTRLSPVMVIHANHAQELNDVVGQALRKLVSAGVPVLNQAVLLRHVNDTLADQVALGERLVNLGVFPYYLHQLDRVRGAAHFEVPVAEGRELIRALRSRLPGYAVPRYVQEVAGEAHKRPLEA
jgi:EF-P beta-lysylation protein EpmB